MVKLLTTLSLATAAAAAPRLCVGDCQQPATVSKMQTVMQLKTLERQECQLVGTCPLVRPASSAQECIEGMAGEYPCKNVDLRSFTPLATLGSKDNGNDIWGWVDPSTNAEIAIMGCTDGTSFVDVTNPEQPSVLGFLPSSNGRTSIWRDIKIFKNYAYIVADSSPRHGMQVVDMNQFRSPLKADNNTDVGEVVSTFLYDEFGSCHNVVINEESGFAYGVGSDTCRGGLHAVDLNEDPAQPTFAGCFSADGYTHDAQCVIYKGPDKRYSDKEICFNYNEDTLTIVDVSDKTNMVMLSRVGYNGYAYTHQGWLTEDQSFLLLDDELDEVEMNNEGYTQTYIWDVTSLTEPKLTGYHFSPVRSIDHNLYIRDTLAYQANYESGLRVLDVSELPIPGAKPTYCDSTESSPAEFCPDGTPCNAKMLPCSSPKECLCPTSRTPEIAFFDVKPERNDVAFFGAWSVFPYFPSGNIIVSSIERGLFVLTLRSDAKAGGNATTAAL